MEFVSIEKGSKFFIDFRSVFPTFTFIQYLVFRQKTTGFIRLSRTSPLVDNGYRTPVALK